MIHEKFQHDANDGYLHKMFSVTSEIRLEADRFFSEDDATQKADIFSSSLEKMISKLNF
jgi:hypothetical protein